MKEEASTAISVLSEALYLRLHGVYLPEHKSSVLHLGS